MIILDYINKQSQQNGYKQSWLNFRRVCTVRYDTCTKKLHKVATDAYSDNNFNLDQLKYIPSSFGAAPESKIFVYKQDVIIKTASCYSSSQSSKIFGKREKITHFSKDSIKRCKLFFRNIPDHSYKFFLTLTYPADYVSNGKLVKYHLKKMKMFLIRNGVQSGAWFLEFQKRGAAHFHLLLDSHVSVAKIARAWSKITNSNDENHYLWHLGKLSGRPCLEKIKKPHAISAYITKYATKQAQKLVPRNYQDVGRFWGYWGNIKPIIHKIYDSRYDSVALFRCLLKDWRVFWKQNSGMDIVKNDLLLRGSGTMWGGSDWFNSRLAMINYVPF